MDDMTPEEQARYSVARARYEAAAHAMQTGVWMKMSYDEQETAPKHLRVGVNSSMVEQGAVAGLLIAKGIFTKVEYMEALASGMEAERDSYEQEVRRATGNQYITLA